MTDATLHIQLIQTGFIRNALQRRADRRRLARAEKELVLAARRLASLSPHLLEDIGLVDAKTRRR